MTGPICPQARPNTNDECSPSQEGLKCYYGTLECCGGPETQFSCSGGTWRGISFACILNCPPETTDPVPVPVRPTCPFQSRPDVNDECSPSQEGLECYYGTVECCGEEFPEILFRCPEGTWEAISFVRECPVPCPPETTVYYSF